MVTKCLPEIVDVPEEIVGKVVVELVNEPLTI